MKQTQIFAVVLWIFESEKRNGFFLSVRKRRSPCALGLFDRVYGNKCQRNEKEGTVCV